MGMSVLGVSSSSPRADLETLLRNAHVISLHCPLTPATTGLLGRTELAMTKPGVIIVNYARGQVIDKEVGLAQSPWLVSGFYKIQPFPVEHWTVF
jgi:phosphoglycerate dehydrogenase-like enzyme